MVDSISAVNAYNQASKMMEKPSSANQSFSELINQKIDQSLGSLKMAEKAGVQAMAGEISVEELTTAVSEAEMQLRTMVTLRDKIVTAYQDIIKMPI